MPSRQPKKTPQTPSASAGVSVRNLTRVRPPQFPYEKAAQALLPGWDISLVFVTPAAAQQLNKKLRKKTYEPNVLAYAAGANSGEVIICPAVAKKQAPAYGIPPAKFAGFLFIHALLHLKGMRHGTTMEKAEREWFSRIASLRIPNETTRRNWH